MDIYSPINYTCHDKIIRLPKSITLEKILTNNFKIFTSNNNELIDFIDIIKKCITWNPDKRLIPKDGLEHNFFRHLDNFKSESEKNILKNEENDKLLED